ncbi:TPA: hypothetical protein ACMDRZ_003261 [Vibrio cholerae]|uniref:hypothetical protein n=1 Tax=Vibrio cholerae TaxID=666 RepID=UPI0015817376|nr:hypothetical protein [Vibrio cholerae]EGR0263964.1 hypothetical protein [Vibrio cholerae]EJL6307336.1 hypothetical protein [Vibrio cholerae]EJL6310957.1 hypothetical protein [Vibrio cholerae]EJL6420416.1 hypothetical protein [Vibrio cholerae]EJL6582321.1 hypothetical protein [Vibrio cholerae]
MQQSDINYLYQLLSPWYDALFTLYGRETGLEFQRLVRMVAEGDSAITLDGKREEFTQYKQLSDILSSGNRITFNHERFEPSKPVEMKHVFAVLHSMTLAVEESASRIPNSVNNRIKKGFLEGRDLNLLVAKLIQC